MSEPKHHSVTAEQVQAFLDGESPDSNVEKVRELLLQRSLKGIQEYGKTTDRTDLSLAEWLRHRLEEVLDDAVYTMKILSELEAKDALDRAMEIERGKA